jgi:hypothetical protein
VVDQQRPAESPVGGNGDGVVQEEAGESTHDSYSDAMDKSSDSASLSFGSDTDFLSDTYVIVDPEVKRNGTGVLESLLHPAAIMNIMAILDGERAQQTVFFPAFSRYFVARGKSYENMIADLIRHSEANQNGGAPLIVCTDVPKLRRIAHKRMGFLKAMYRIFKDSSATIEQPNIDLIKTYMKACVRHYHVLLPQLDLLAAQWRVDDDDDLGLDDLGSLRSEGVRTRRQTSLDEQLRIQVQEAKKRQVGTLEKSRTPPQGASSSNSTKVFLQGKTLNSNPSEELQRMTRQAKDEVTKRRLTEERLSRIEEDYRNLQRQHKSSASTLTGSTIPPVQLSLSVPTDNPRLLPLPPERLPLLPPDSVSSSYTPQESNASSDVGMQLLQVLRDATSTAGGGGFGAGTKLIEAYPDGHTMRTFYKSLVQPWDIIPPETGSVKEYYKVRDANKHQFAGDRIKFPVWRRRFLATVHSSRMLISDKGLALSMALDKNK